MPARIQFFYFDAGGGHRAAATALQAVIERLQLPWDVRLVNLQELLDRIDILRRFTGLRIQDFYNLLLKRGWTLGASHLLKLLHAVIRLYHPAQVRILREFWAEAPPDMVVSLIPNFNRALCEAYRELRPGGPFVTILTDISDYPPHFWIEKLDQVVICGSDRAVRQAREIGVAPGNIRRVSGMILRPHFYEPVNVDVPSERKRLGLQPDLPTGLVLFGGQGSKTMLTIARRLQEVRTGLQLIMICGRNQALAAKLRALPSRIPIHVEEFTNEIPYFMRLSDFLIGKPGPGSISEAVHMDLPVIVQSNLWTLPQERFNADWVTEQDLGIVISGFHEITGAVERLLDPANFERFRANARAVDNRAVFEIPEILAEILAGGTVSAFQTK